MDTAAVYANNFTEEQRKSVSLTSTDKAHGLPVATMRQVCPMLRGCALGPSHLDMAAERPTWERRNKLPIKLRRIICKFDPKERCKAADGEFYDDGDSIGSTEGNRMENAIVKDGSGQRYAINHLSNISPVEGFDSRGEFCRYLAHLVSSFPDREKEGAYF